MTPLKPMDATENKVCTQCSLENTLRSKTIAPTSKTRVAMRPNVKNTSAKPPATAASPVAFSCEIPLTAFMKPNIRGTAGAQASNTPQRNRLLLRSSIRAASFPYQLNEINTYLLVGWQVGGMS